MMTRIFFNPGFPAGVRPDPPGRTALQTAAHPSLPAAPLPLRDPGRDEGLRRRGVPAVSAHGPLQPGRAGAVQRAGPEPAHRAAPPPRQHGRDPRQEAGGREAAAAQAALWNRNFSKVGTGTGTITFQK